MRHQPYKKLEGYKREHSITNAMIAKVLGISEVSVQHKNVGRTDYYLSEVDTLERELGIPIRVFLSN